MERLCIAFVVSALAAGPLFALADTSATSPEVQHLAAIAAALSAQEMALTSGAPLACGLIASKTHVRANEFFVLAWGSIGAMSPGDDPNISMWVPNGASVVYLSSLGTWIYHFTFYGRSGGSVTCSTAVSVGDE